jgi:hypothetical protein
MDKVIIIGDSFVAEPNPLDVPENINEDYYWVDVLRKKYSSHNFFVDGISSRNAQSVLDNWIKLIPSINENDILIICFPFLGRTRLPITNGQGQYDDLGNLIYTDRFIGTASYNKNHNTLYYWGNEYPNNYFIDLLKPQEIINSSDSSYYNFYEIIDSLKKLTKCKSYLFTWDNMKINGPNIEDKSTITQNIGSWETFEDVWKKTNGQDGMDGNFHWSFPYNKLFGEYVLTKF